jgi:hypothetical protein
MFSVQRLLEILLSILFYLKHLLERAESFPYDLSHSHSEVYILCLLARRFLGSFIVALTWVSPCSQESYTTLACCRTYLAFVARLKHVRLPFRPCFFMRASFSLVDPPICREIGHVVVYRD